MISRSCLPTITGSNLHHEFLRGAARPGRRHRYGIVRYRAVTEPAQAVAADSLQLTKFVMAGRVPAIHALQAALAFVGMTILSRRYMTLFANAEEERQ
jgi:hypothetical protein